MANKTAFKVIQLKPVTHPVESYEQLEKRLKDFFKREIYLPLIKTLGEPHTALKNARPTFEAWSEETKLYPSLLDALMSGKVTFNRGEFSGRFNAGLTKELRQLGATFDKRTSTFRIPIGEIPMPMRSAIAASEDKFKEKIEAIDRKLAQLLPEEVAGKFKCADLFDKTIWKADRDFHTNVKGLTVAPALTPQSRMKIAMGWQNNMELWIKDFTEKQITDMRGEIRKSVFAGNRYGSAVETITKSYTQSENKSRFLARQETSLLVSKFQESRYQDAGILEYTWHCVAGSPNHPVRPRHKALADASKTGTIYKWSDPPNTAEPGETPRYNNPRCDYNCRCFARPVVRFKK